MSLTWQPPHLSRLPMTPWWAKWTWTGSRRFSSRNSADTGSSLMYLEMRHMGGLASQREEAEGLGLATSAEGSSFAA